MGTWTCAPCNRDFVSQIARTHHINNSSRHPRCDRCKRGFLDEQSKLQHLRTSVAHRDTYCSLCDRQFNSRFALEQHKQAAIAHVLADPDSDSDSDDAGPSWRTDSDDSVVPDESDEEIEATHSATFIVQSEDEALEGELALIRRSAYITTPSTTSIEASDSEQLDSETSSYLDTEEEETTSSGEESADSDYLEQTSNADSDTSEVPISLTSDLQRSTITRAPIPRLSGASQNPSVHERNTSVSPAASASSGTLTSVCSRANTDSEFLAPKGKSPGSGYTCPLCLEQDGESSLELSSIKCGHVFCSPCISRALERKHQCPVCRARAKTKHLRRIFLTF